MSDYITRSNSRQLLELGRIYYFFPFNCLSVELFATRSHIVLALCQSLSDLFSFMFTIEEICFLWSNIVVNNLFPFTRVLPLLYYVNWSGAVSATSCSLSLMNILTWLRQSLNICIQCLKTFYVLRIFEEWVRRYVNVYKVGADAISFGKLFHLFKVLG